MIITWGGSALLLGPLSLIFSVILYFRRRIRDSLLMVGGFSGAMILSHLLKILVARPRPEMEKMLVTMPSDFSFPSAHTSQIFAFALSSVIVLHGDLSKTRRKTVRAILMSLAILVGISRVYLEVHYISDVIFGALLAIVWVVILHKLSTKIIRTT